jgi:xanthine dehydrogenase accessory factor
MSIAGGNWLEELRGAVEREGIAVRVAVMAAEGSTPRETGAAMLVTPAGLIGTIGGGELELQATLAARRMMTQVAAGSWQRATLSLPLGPALGQCCGGHVRLLLEAYGAEEVAALADVGARGQPALVLRPTASGGPLLAVDDRTAAKRMPVPLPVAKLATEMLSGQQQAAARLVRGRRGEGDWYVEPLASPAIPLVLYGAGHVGRALVRVLDGLPFAVTWVDTAPGRFPDVCPANANRLVSPNLAAIAGAAPLHAWHLVMTYSHALDLEICHAVLSRGSFAYLGLIGSATKRARFVKRLGDLGHQAAEIARMHCPIGLEGLSGKAPAVIALSVAADLVMRANAANAEAVMNQAAQARA